MLSKKTFTKGMLLFLSTFRGVDADKETQKAWYLLLRYMNDEQFYKAVVKICQGMTDFYPTTNFVAVIRNAAFTEMRRYTVICRCGHEFNLGEFAELACPRCSANYIRGKGPQDKDELPPPRDLMLVPDYAELARKRKERMNNE